MATNKATHSGTCQVCGRLQKLPGGVLSKHGYEVARWGFFNGVCWGEGHVPFEVGTDCLDRAINGAQDRVDKINRAIETLMAEPITNTAPVRQYIGRRQEQYREVLVTLVPDSTNYFYLEQYADGTIDRFARHSNRTPLAEIVTGLRKGRVRRYQEDIAELHKYIAWQQGRIHNWKPGKLTPVKGVAA